MEAHAELAVVLRVLGVVALVEELGAVEQRVAVVAFGIAAERRLEDAGDPRMRQQLEMVLASKEEQLANLSELARTVEGGHLQLENTVSDLGTLYSQFALLEARDVESGRVQRMSQDIDEVIAALGDVISTLDQLYKKSAEA